MNPRPRDGAARGHSVRLDNLTRRFTLPDGSAITVLDGVCAEIAPGETVAIIGPSGSGKSTLLNLIGGLDAPTAGTVRVGETEVARLGARELAQFRATQVGFVFQDHHLLPQLTALENVLLPTLAAGARGDAEGRAAGLLDRVGLTGRMDTFPGSMSGGERQRVAVARALINEPGLLLCDEPTGNLDRRTGAEVVSVLLDLAAAHGVTVLMVTHNTGQAARFGRCLRLVDGRLGPASAADLAGDAP